MTNTFTTFYRLLRDREPYPWQKRLATDIANNVWPETISLPTGAGKSTMLDIWAWAIVTGLANTPRRLYWCVDRQLVVDAIAKSAQDLLNVLPGLQLAALHGGMDLSDFGVTDPIAPAVITTTVDQLGSRLLFGAYGSSRYAAPIHAGLAGNDALIVLDEAQISVPFASTLDAIGKLRGDKLGLPWRVIQVSATPHGDLGFTLDEDDHAHPPLLRRLSAPKLVTLVECEARDLAKRLAAEAVELRAGGGEVVAVVCNRVRTARKVFRILSQEGETALLTGRVRPADRDRLLAEYLPRIEAGSRAKGRKPLYVVATQTIEVGADLDFDAMVTECASISAILQRVGRLNRTGELDFARLVVVRAKADAKSEDKEDPIYGKDVKVAWKWLKERLTGKGKNKDANLAPMALRGIERPREIAPKFPMLGSTDVTVMAQTSVKHDIDLAPWLHGWSHKAECSVLWRTDLPVDPAEWNDYLDAIPPAANEILTLPVWELSSWLLEHHTDTPIAKWDGDEVRIAFGRMGVKAGDSVVLPASYGNCDRWGWAPDIPDVHAQVDDLADNEHRTRLTDAEVIARWRNEELTDEELLLAHGIEPEGNWRLVEYPGGVLMLRGAPSPEQSGGTRVLLSDHSHGVAAKARQYAGRLSGELAIACERAGGWHDIGKADERWQAAMGEDGKILAKSVNRTETQVKAAWRATGLPRGWRHEMRSLANVSQATDLERYLIGTHHGRGRPCLPAQPDPQLWRASGGEEWPSLFSELQERFGYWGLAYLETVMRLADWAQSREEIKRA
ncbi:MAG: type I-U CRISPR-associated helicase/endonuclease Cas3 [Methylococcaceae bacterium]|nr:type I-U CRISPR-associated helicase/endonuclease Cas3 [Methylococcaceae bacterium]